MRSFCDRCRALVWAVAVLVALVTAAQAGPYEDALAKFTTDSFSDTAEGIDGVARSGSPLAETVITALQDGRLFFSAADKGVYFKDASDKLFNAATGEAVAGTPPGDLAPVRLNNRLRGMLAAAVGSLTLMSPDPEKRLQAAQAVFKSRDPNALATLDLAHPEGEGFPRQAGDDRGARRGRALFRQGIRE